MGVKISREYKEAIEKSGFMRLADVPIAKSGHARVDITCDNGKVRTVHCPASPGDWRGWKNFMSFAKQIKAGVR